jgi:creatinine amidohydrolase
MAISKTMPYMYGNLNWKDLEQLRERGRCVFLLPAGSTESHGPHGPVATDMICGLETCLRAAEKLHRKGYEAFVLPPLAYGVTECARNFVGTISISPKTVFSLIFEICCQLINHGLLKICIYSSHAEPAHIKAVYDAVDGVFEKTGIKPLFINIFRKKYMERLPEHLRELSHADDGETSMVMAVDPSLVNEERRKKLKELPINLVEKLFKERLDEFKAMGLVESYCGDPASASPEKGEEGFNILSDFIVEGVEEMFEGKVDDNRGLYGRET